MAQIYKINGCTWPSVAGINVKHAQGLPLFSLNMDNLYPFKSLTWSRAVLSEFLHFFT